MWRVADGRQQVVFERHSARVAAAAWSPDGNRIALGSSDGSASVWRADGPFEASLLGHDGDVIGVQGSPDGRFIATTSEDRTARVFRPDGAHVGTLAGHRRALRSATWRPHAHEQPQLLTSSDDGTVRIWAPEIAPGNTVSRTPTDTWRMLEEQDVQSEIIDEGPTREASQ